MMSLAKVSTQMFENETETQDHKGKVWFVMSLRHGVMLRL
jgi:hypothetical protein